MFLILNTTILLLSMYILTDYCGDREKLPIQLYLLGIIITLLTFPVDHLLLIVLEGKYYSDPMKTDELLLCVVLLVVSDVIPSDGINSSSMKIIQTGLNLCILQCSEQWGLLNWYSDDP